MNANGSHDAIAETEREAEAQQGAIPPPYVPPEPPAAEKPKALAPFSLEWFDANLQAQQQIAEQHYNNWQQSLGALNVMRAQRDLVLKQQANDVP